MFFFSSFSIHLSVLPCIFSHFIFLSRYLSFLFLSFSLAEIMNLSRKETICLEVPKRNETKRRVTYFCEILGVPHPPNGFFNQVLQRLFTLTEVGRYSNTKRKQNPKHLKTQCARNTPES